MTAQFLARPDFLWSAEGAAAVLLVGFILVAIINKITTRFVGLTIVPASFRKAGPS